MKAKIGAALAAATLLASCERPPEAAQDEFWAALQSHCGNAYAGKLVSNDAADADFQGAEMIAHFRRCTDQSISIPFHVRTKDGEWDRSRTWIISRVIDDGNAALSLDHDHRHEDGTSDPVTYYGGITRTPGQADYQAFEVSEGSIALFEREGLTASVTNTWGFQVDPMGTPDAIFAYELVRSTEKGAPEDRHFRVEFDATKPVMPPPAPWGFENDQALGDAVAEE